MVRVKFHRLLPIGGEGKHTFLCNIASVLGLSGKKPFYWDGRKPKIFGDFKVDNKIGISNYLTGEVKWNKSSTRPEFRFRCNHFLSYSPNPSRILMSRETNNL